ncbi:uncharacterized protein LOC120940879 [Rana temporaria]|uniref:uncharacterized protein LOC120937712 n=1 Tax=Rana temporaria TaxID=8407 RepID=UPI001AACBFA4|nr:uncharacterized protein LOC120937712 [Rana temporaria]XP_040209912.1 uncharacterized protein LOC120940879 [Rana temporaria]
MSSQQPQNAPRSPDRSRSPKIRHERRKKSRHRSKSPQASGSRATHRSHSSPARKSSHSATVAEQDGSRPRPDDGLCWACSAPSEPGKLLCAGCIKDMATDREAEAKRIKDYIQDAVAEGIQAASATKTPRSRPKVSSVNQPGRDDSPTRETLSPGSSDSEEPSEYLFDFQYIESFVTAIREAIDWDQDVQPPEKIKRFFPSRKRQGVTFPLLPEIREWFEEEWERPERRANVQNRFSRLYPFKTPEADLWDSPLGIDAALQRLARQVALPLQDSTTFRDPMDRRADTDLKKVYSAAGAACRPAIALTSVSRALKVWTTRTQAALKAETGSEALIQTMEDFDLAADFIAEASMDLTKLLAKIMAFAVTAKRALWLRHWGADSTSKLSLCNIPFNGKVLFGKTLEEAISRATGGKSGLMPQRPRKRQQATRPAQPEYKRAYDARAYRPGREYTRPYWKNPQNSFLRKVKSRAAQTAKKPEKSF